MLRYIPSCTRLLVLGTLLVTGCSVNKWAVKKASGALAAGGSSTLFTGEDDPELVEESLPVLIKVHEGLLEANPDDPELLLATGKLVCTYAYAFVQLPAEQLTDEQIAEQTRALARTKKLYLRAHRYLLKAMDLRHAGFSRDLTANRVEPALAKTALQDTAYLYWTGMSWMGAITADKSDMGMVVNMSKAVALLQRVLDLHPGYDNGAVHDFFVSYYGSAPEAMGGSEAKAREHFKKAVEISGNTLAGPYVSLAASVCINKQKLEEFRSLLGQALAVDVSHPTPSRLVNILQQQKAQWLLNNIGNFFLLDDEEPEEGTDEKTAEDSEE